MAEKARSVFLIFALLLALSVLAGCARGQAGVTLAGSTSVQPFAEALAEEFMREQPGAVINVQGGGSSAGIQAAISGAAEIGMSSRELKKEEEATLKPVTIALDAIAIAVHPSNPVKDLSVDQVRSIFSAQVRNWQAFGGPDKPIDVVTREEGSGTRGAFQELVMGKTDIYPGAIVQDSNGAVRQVVADDPNAIGYISLGLVNQQVKAVSVGGIIPSVDAVKQGTYKLVRPFLYVVKGQPAIGADAFIQFTLGEKGQSMLASEGLVPAK